MVAPGAHSRINWTLLATVSFAALLTSITTSVVNVVLPDIAKEFSVDPSRAAWVILSFLLTVTVLLLVGGRLGDMFGPGRVYLSGFAVFGLGSLGCGLAPSETWLIGMRVLQASGSAMVSASSPALLTLSVPSNRRGMALGLMSTSVYVGLAIGPPVGGELVRLFGWRSIFYVMASAMFIVLVVGLRSLPLGCPEGKRNTFDFVGALMIGLGNLSFLLACSRAPAWGWTHPLTLGLMATALVIAPLFVLYELRHPAPTVDPRMFRVPVFSSATAAAVLNYFSVFQALYFLPFALRDGQGLDAAYTGRVLASQAAGMALMALLSGWLSDKVGSRGLAAAGMVITAIGLAGLALMWPTTGLAAPIVFLFICGAGTGIFITPNSSALMGAVPRHQQGIAGGIMGLARTMGMALGVATGSAMFATVFPSGRVDTWPDAADRVVQIGLFVGAAASMLAAAVSFFGHRTPNR